MYLKDSTTHGFRYPLRILEHIPLIWGRRLYKKGGGIFLYGFISISLILR
jgi:hypothetical protein